MLNEPMMPHNVSSELRQFIEATNRIFAAFDYNDIGASLQLSRSFGYLGLAEYIADYPNIYIQEVQHLNKSS